jgi:hypothetical protein
MVHDARITAYTYEADTFCRGCMWEIIMFWDSITPAVRQVGKEGSVEALLDAAASHLGIDRQEEGSFNSCAFPDSVIPVFPKVVFESQICQENCGDDSCDHEATGCWHETCGSCDMRLCEQ